MAGKTTTGKMRGCVTIGVDDDGKKIYKYVSGTTKLELELAKQSAKEHFLYGREIPDDLCFAEYAENWYRIRKEPFISNASKSSYKVLFFKHLLPEFGLQKMKAIDANQLQTFVNGFAGMSRSQITSVVGTLKQIFSTAFAEGSIERDPSIALIRPKAAKVEPRRPLTPEETKHVLRSIETHPEGLFLAVLYYLGVRRGEALGLKWGDFNFEEGQVHIQRDIDFTHSRSQEDTLKTEAAERFIPVPDKLRDLLLPKQGEPDELLFHDKYGNPLSQATYKRMWARLMVDCECVEWKEPKGGSRPDDILKRIKPTLTPHFLRHNYVTLLYESGVDPLVAMKIVGHTDYQTTANIYTHIRDDMLKKAAVDMEEVFRARA